MLTISARGLRFAALFGFLGLAWSQTTAFGQQIQLEPKTKPGFIDLLGPEKAGAKPKGQAERPIQAELKPAKGKAADLKPGDEVILAITINVPANSYTYSTTTENGGKTQFSIKTTKGLDAVDETFQPEREPKTVFDPLQRPRPKISETHHLDAEISLGPRCQAGGGAGRRQSHRPDLR